jgi:hypothetical protein
MMMVDAAVVPLLRSACVHKERITVARQLTRHATALNCDIRTVCVAAWNHEKLLDLQSTSHSLFCTLSLFLSIYLSIYLFVFASHSTPISFASSSLIHPLHALYTVHTTIPSITYLLHLACRDTYP